MLELRNGGLRVIDRRESFDLDGKLRSDLVETARINKRDILRALREERLVVDPREDLEDDAMEWDRLLRLAYERDGDDSRGLFMALHGMRCLGARLRWQEGASGRFLALYRGAEMEASEYAEARQRYLAPHAEAIRKLFAQISAEYARWLAQQPRTNNGE
ncbi:MAG: hypothetical protein BPHS0_48 [Phage 5P_3]|nr:MAG: hypothetical protein BPHS0_48 [Phage 5P_3]